MIRALRDALNAMPEPKRVTVAAWRKHANDGPVTLSARQRIDVPHRKARFMQLDPHTPYTGWVNPGRFTAGTAWLLVIAGMAVYGRKKGRGPLGALKDWEPFSDVTEQR